MADESLLTGESVPVRKREWDGEDRDPYTGRGRYSFCFFRFDDCPGERDRKGISNRHQTEIGKIGKALESVKEEPTRLKKEMGHLSNGLPS